MKKILNYENGDKYDGDVIDDIRNGVGTMIYSNGNKYIGDWENDKKQGVGVLYKKNGDIYKGQWFNDKLDGKCDMIFKSGLTYNGDIKNGVITGYGNMKYDNGERYTGHFLNNKKHGTGVLETDDGVYYNGDWFDNKIQGNGNMIYSTRENYIGSFVNNMRNGKGVMTYIDRSTYNGFWVNNLRQGNGNMKYINGNEYDGDWNNNVRSGNGKYYDVEYGYEYDGMWENDHMNGYGKMIYSDGSEYEGMWRDNMNHGKGKMKYYGGDVYEGDWFTNKRQGKGIMTFVGEKILNGRSVLETHKINHKIISTYEGDWYEDLRQGKGTMTFPSKKTLEIEIENPFIKKYDEYREPDKEIIVVDLNDQRRYGRDTITYEDNELYEGNWLNDKQNGHGMMKYFNGNVYEGEWFNNKYHGLGTITYAEGSVHSIYQGYFYKGMKNGIGATKTNTGKIINENWSFGIQLDKHNKKILLKSASILINDTDIKEEYKTCKYINDNIHEDLDKYSYNKLQTMLLYSHNGDILVNSYLRNNMKLNDFIIDYYRTKYYESFRELENVFVSDSDRTIEMYIRGYYYSMKKCFLTKFDHNIVLYRGIKSVPDLKVKDVIQNECFVSTSCDINVAKGFAGEYGSIFSIEVPANTYICPMYLSTHYYNEYEILLPNDSCFYVKSIDGNIFNLSLFYLVGEYYEYNGDQIILSKENVLQLRSLPKINL